MSRLRPERRPPSSLSRPRPPSLLLPTRKEPLHLRRLCLLSPLPPPLLPLPAPAVSSPPPSRCPPPARRLWVRLRLHRRKGFRVRVQRPRLHPPLLLPASTAVPAVDWLCSRPLLSPPNPTPSPLATATLPPLQALCPTVSRSALRWRGAVRCCCPHSSPPSSPPPPLLPPPPLPLFEGRTRRRHESRSQPTGPLPPRPPPRPLSPLPPPQWRRRRPPLCWRPRSCT